jgi:hypothetical protein
VEDPAEAIDVEELPSGETDGEDGLRSDPSGKKDTIGISKDPAGDERP